MRPTTVISNVVFFNSKIKMIYTFVIERLFSIYHLELVRTIKLLIRKGADVNAENKSGATALLYASQNGYYSLKHKFYVCQ